MKITKEYKGPFFKMWTWQFKASYSWIEDYGVQENTFVEWVKFLTSIPIIVLCVIIWCIPALMISFIHNIKDFQEGRKAILNGNLEFIKSAIKSGILIKIKKENKNEAYND